MFRNNPKKLGFSQMLNKHVILFMTMGFSSFEYFRIRELLLLIFAIA
jgi:hypothetical protein